MAGETPVDVNVSVRGLVDSDMGTPLREFKGKLDSYYPETRQFGTVVVLNYKDVEVIKAIEPYNFPIATLAIKLSNRKKSGWGIFGDSLALLLPPDQDIKDCVGKVMRLRMMEEGFEYGQDRNTGEKMIGYPWQVKELEGTSTSVGGAIQSTKDIAKSLLIGKTRAEFNKAAYSHPEIRKDVPLQRSITDKSFINALVQLGEVVEDENGVFQAGKKA
jgi:hypothetical protein